MGLEHVTFRRPGATKKARSLRRDETGAERLLWRRISGRELAGFKFVRQIPVGPYVVDFVCRAEKLVIELDGDQHAWSATDAARTAWLNAQGYSVLRFWNHEVFKELEGVLDVTLAVLEGRTQARSSGLRFDPAPAPSPGRFATRPLPRGEREQP